ncbi:MAG: hypothetical protein ACE148_02500 [Vicinamibacterales bacterium]
MMSKPAPSRAFQVAFLASAAFVAAGAVALPALAQSLKQPAGENDLDRFMAKVLERREENWKTLHDYVLDEVERFELVGPGGIRLHGMNREFTWYVRDGYFIRSPVRFDGVTLAEDKRRGYEERWLSEEKERERREKEEQEKPDARRGVTPGDPSLDGFVSERGEPRFVSEAYFLKFKFEPGNYYFAGREQLDGREVVRIEYYPTRLFSGAGQRSEERGRQEARKEVAGKGPGEPGERRRAMDEDEFERKMNKVAVVTLWVDPSEYQIVRYTFDNVDFGFLPGRWLVRVDAVKATMTMTRVFDGVWLPKRLNMEAGITLASGSYRLSYGRDFSEYRRAETSARIRGYRGSDER